MTHRRAQKSIMIVEDDPFIAMDLEDTFEAEGYIILGPFADVESGLEFLKNDVPDFAMLDYNLGRETSIPLARTLQKQGIPYVFLSGQAEQVVMSHDILARPVIAKPFVPEQLIELVENSI